MPRSKQTGVLLIQLGTPDFPTTSSCREYLQEFLMDPRVIDIPWLLRALLVYGIIGPFRSPKTAAAYKMIWTSEGSPLRFHSEGLRKKLQTTLGESFLVSLGMRYGNPSIKMALEELKQKNISKLLIIPLYPHYASASFGSSVEKVFDLLKQEVNIPFLSILPPFFADQFFIDAFTKIGNESNVQSFDHVLMSFHGLPERQILKSDLNNQCLKPQCCEQEMVPAYCYKGQSYKTAKLLSEKMGLSSDKVTVCFQSRLGRTPWIRPFTDEVIIDLAKKGKKNIAVICPSFVADCLETLEEITVRGQELFRAHGGERLTLVPSLNTHPFWIENLAQKIRHFLSD